MNKKIIGRNLFLLACQIGRKDILQLMPNYLDVNVYLNEANKDGYTGLMMACVNGYKNVCKMLMSSTNIDVNAQSSFDRTAFIIGCEFGNEEIFVRHDS